MPRGDQTGPEGLGPMTGRKMGYCTGYDTPGFTKPGKGAGLAHRHGGRRALGKRHRNRITYIPIQEDKADFERRVSQNSTRRRPTKEEEINYLENTAEELKDRLNIIMDRIDELKNLSEDTKKEKNNKDNL